MCKKKKKLLSFDKQQTEQRLCKNDTCAIIIYVKGLKRLCTQPYFPPQIVFSPDNGQIIIAIDEINQRAYKAINLNSSSREISYVMQHFPYANPDSPQSKYYVQLLIDSPRLYCMYGTYWKYGGNNFNRFPSHWWFNTSSFTVDNYLKFKYGMIYSNGVQVQILTITRVKDGPETTLIPIFNGEGFDLVPSDIYPIFIQ
ncbi:unnamed protein product [Rotaria sp. Silwood1]|nr:unnamed protein product [Rotaria sp. Silwood1]CAF4732045.1 unnamed protein product [Rotaria sp. Silwood1]